MEEFSVDEVLGIVLLFFFCTSSDVSLGAEQEHAIGHQQEGSSTYLDSSHMRTSHFEGTRSQHKETRKNITKIQMRKLEVLTTKFGDSLSVESVRKLAHEKKLDAKMVRITRQHAQR